MLEFNFFYQTTPVRLIFLAIPFLSSLCYFLYSFLGIFVLIFFFLLLKLLIRVFFLVMLPLFLLKFLFWSSCMSFLLLGIAEVFLRFFYLLESSFWSFFVFSLLLLEFSFLPSFYYFLSTTEIPLLETWNHSLATGFLLSLTFCRVSLEISEFSWIISLH